MALRQHVHLLLLRQELDIDTLAHRLPWQSEQGLLQFRQPALGRADEIGDGRIGLAHLGKHLLGRNAAIHDPDALRLAVLGLDLAQGVAQRRAVRRVPRQHFVSKRKAVGRHDQRDHHLGAVAALVAAVAVAPLVVFIVRLRGLKISAGQIIEQHFETGPEQVLPALAQMIEQRRLVLHKLVEAAVEGMYLHQPIIGAQQITHRALLEPLPVQSPLAAGIDQPVTHQRLQDMPPLRPFARIRKTLRPEPIEFQLLIQLTRQKARAPLPRPVQFHRIKPHLHAITFGAGRNLTIGRKQRQLAVPPAAFIKGFDQLTPSLALAVIDLAEIQHLPLDHLATGATLVLDDIPVAMLFAIFEASVEPQEHDANQPTPTGIVKKRW